MRATTGTDSASDRILFRDRKLSFSLRSEPTTYAWILAALGTALVISAVGAIALNWLTPRLDNLAWLFAATQSSSEAVPLNALGAVLICAGLIRHPSLDPVWTRAAAAALIVSAIALLALAAILAHTGQTIASQTPVEAMYIFRREMLTGLLRLGVFAFGFVAVALALWSSVEKGG